MDKCDEFYGIFQSFFIEIFRCPRFRHGRPAEHGKKSGFPAAANVPVRLPQSLENPLDLPRGMCYTEYVIFIRDIPPGGAAPALLQNRDRKRCCACVEWENG